MDSRLPVAGADVGVAAVTWVNLSRLSALSAQLEDLCAQFAPEGRALAEEPGLARACGRPALLHPFIMTSLSRRALWDAGSFETRLSAGDLGAALIGFDPSLPVTGAHRDRWTEPAVRAFAAARSSTAYPGRVWVISW